MAQQSLLGYLKDNLSMPIEGSKNGDFVKEYRTLTADDKADLVRYAREEATVIGIEFAEPVAV